MTDTDNINNTSIGYAIGGSISDGGGSPVVNALAKHFGRYSYNEKDDDSKDSAPVETRDRIKNGTTG